MFVIKLFAFFIKLKTYLLGEMWNTVRGQWEDRVRQEGVKVIAWSVRAKSLLSSKQDITQDFSSVSLQMKAIVFPSLAVSAVIALFSSIDC